MSLLQSPSSPAFCRGWCWVCSMQRFPLGQQFPFRAGCSCLCLLLLPFSPLWEMLLQHFTAKLWGHVSLHRSTRLTLLYQFHSPTMSQPFHFHFLPVKQHRPSSSPPGGPHTSPSTASSTATDRETRQDQSGPEVQVGPLPPSRASWRWGSPALTYSYGCTWFIYQFHPRHSFQWNWGKDLLQEGLFLPRAVQGCCHVRQDDAGSVPLCDWQGMFRARHSAGSQNEKTPQVL